MKHQIVLIVSDAFGVLHVALLGLPTDEGPQGRAARGSMTGSGPAGAPAVGQPSVSSDGNTEDRAGRRTPRLQVAKGHVQHAGLSAVTYGQVWTPGYWSWDGARYVWVPGRYVVAPFPDAV